MTKILAILCAITSFIFLVTVTVGMAYAWPPVWFFWLLGVSFATAVVSGMTAMFLDGL
ncbi:hypothetical protein JRC04_05545 [Mycolicibacterium sp. S2-37]|uniref:hypothetical protein n=1 Tax=Mycolicibacterium sp. S2-37 TaxID=2810297 RepID=UPI001A94E107|nr:hypothetical protein [Mycolicibacterium sp. S2-37]MBO0676920.1 hypothetical protein [Mycolicibacterium sp. S2-37]